MIDNSTKLDISTVAPLAGMQCYRQPFSVLMIDPPWLKKKGGLRKARPNQGRNLDYETMPTDKIFDLLDAEIFNNTTENHAVFMWTIEQYLNDCDKYMEQRGYRRHCRFIWDKTNGVAPAFTVRYSHEYLIWYYKEKMLPISKEQQGKFMTVFSEKAREHSRKPEYAYRMVEALYPNENRIDVFSREKREGWYQFGNQTDHF
jgi:N6-adenosine-specific RNA methylase IME4